MYDKKGQKLTLLALLCSGYEQPKLVPHEMQR